MDELCVIYIYPMEMGLKMENLDFVTNPTQAFVGFVSLWKMKAFISHLSITGHSLGKIKCCLILLKNDRWIQHLFFLLWKVKESVMFVEYFIICLHWKSQWSHQLCVIYIYPTRISLKTISSEYPYQSRTRSCCQTYVSHNTHFFLFRFEKWERL